MLTTLPYCNFNSYCENTKLYLILIYRHADCFKSINLKAANSQYVFKQYNTIRPLAGYGLPPPRGEFCRLYFFLKPNVLQGLCNMLAL